jgi:major membrane immunogen (membrane-anchored lipoprotein)
MAFTFSLIACGGPEKPSGIYEGSYNSLYTFEGDKYTLEVMGMKIEGTFQIKYQSLDDAKWSEIIFTDSNGKKQTMMYEIKGDMLKLAGSTFIKKK